VDQLKKVKEMIKKYDLKITTIHQHIGSGILDETLYMKATEKLLETAMQFDTLESLDFGGGFGVPYTATDNALDMASLGQKITTRLETFMKAYKKNLTVRFEPGKYLVA